MGADLSNYSNDELLQVLAEEIGFRFEVPDILTFIDDEYYMGWKYWNNDTNSSGVYPYWRDKLVELYPNPITTTSSYIVVTGCIGCLSGDTSVVVCLDGYSTTMTMKEIYNLFPSREITVYAADTTEDNLVKAKVINAFISGVKKTYIITLSNRTEFRCTSNHQFLTKERQWQSIDTGLAVGTTLAPNNLQIINIEEYEEELVYDLTVDVHHNFLLANGIFAHNCGKSTFSQIVLMYDYIKLLSMKNPGTFLRMLNFNGIKLFGASIYKYKAIEFVDSINEALEHAPFIQDLKKSGQFNAGIQIEPAYSIKSIVSTDAAVIWLSEINVHKDADELINSSLSRMQGRFRRGLGLFCHFILDCSDTTVDSPTMRFAHSSAYANQVFLVQPSIWEVKPWDYWGRNPKSFKVYGGDSVVSPHIIDEDEDTSTYDQARILEVPMELYNEFSSDVNLALQEKAGLALIAGGMFFPEPQIKNYFNLSQLIHDVETVDFYDDTQILDIDGMTEMIETFLPDDKYIFVGLDCGYATDEYGIAIGYADATSYVDVDNNLQEKVVKDYYIKFPLVFGLSRKKGQVTSITKVRNFLYSLNERHPIHTVAYDNFQTEQLAQEMKLLNINVKYISVEKDKHYLDFKHSLCEGKISLPKNERLYREFKCLKLLDGNRIDHSDMEAVNVDGTAVKGVNAKDMCDAVVRCHAIIRANLDVSLDVPLENSEYHANQWIDALSNLEQIRTEQKYMQQFAIKCGTNPTKIRGGGHGLF